MWHRLEPSWIVWLGILALALFGLSGVGQDNLAKILLLKATLRLDSATAFDQARSTGAESCGSSATVLRLETRRRLRLRDAQDAAEYASRCVSVEPLNHLILLDLGWIQWKAGHRASAVVTWRSLSHQQPMIVRLLYSAVGAANPFYSLPDTQETWQAIAAVGRESIHAASTRRELYILMRQIYVVKLSDPVQGMQWLETALKNDLQDWQVYWLLYNDAITCGKYSAAQVFLEKAWSLDPDNRHRTLSDYYWRYGSVLLRQQRLDEAAYWLGRCLESAAGKVECKVELGETLFSLKRYPESLHVFNSIDRHSGVGYEDLIVRRIQQLEQILGTNPER